MERKIIVTQFNTTLNVLISLVMKKTKSEEKLATLDRLKKRMSLAKSSDPELLIRESYDFFAKYSKQIVSRDEQFLMGLNLRSEVSGDESDMIIPLIDSIRVQYKGSSVAEKDVLYGKFKELFDLCIKFKTIG